jgi:TrmH family RNA methyltransferase
LEGTPRGSALKSALAGSGVTLLEVPPGELDALADTEQPQGIVAVIEPPGRVLDDISTPAGAVLLVLDAVQDPGNVGTMLRTALALGASGVVALKGTADLTNPKVLRGSMGAAFRLPAAPAGVEQSVAWARARGVEVIVTAADGTPLERWRRGPAPIALVVGNEGAGVSTALAAVATRRVAIPLASTVESLNVAVAAGILLYEVMRDA